MGSFLRKWWRLLTAVALISVAIQIFVHPPAALSRTDAVHASASLVFRPVYLAVDYVRQGISSIWSHYIALVGVSRENERLRQEIVTLREKLQENRDAVLENRRLKDLLSFSGSVERKAIGARVVGHDISPWFQAVFIDAGLESGVEAGMAVVTPYGGMGRVHKTYRGVSEVLLVTDGRFAADVIVERSRVRAIAEGMGGNLCRLKYVSPTQDVVAGDRILFSGFDGSMPKGTLLGTVISADKPREGLFQKIQVQCAVNLQAAEEVLVVLSRPSIPFRTGKL
ncbi:MAG: rod shape-determining protein MreC [Deltaproteobacteria bacterium]|nr:rod shape-determining protein MreC [Deltaproteobacteria bacterium]